MTSTPPRAGLQQPLRGKPAPHRSDQQAGHDEAAESAELQARRQRSAAGLPTEARSGRSATMPQLRGGDEAEAKGALRSPGLQAPDEVRRLRCGHGCKARGPHSFRPGICWDCHLFPNGRMRPNPN